MKYLICLVGESGTGKDTIMKLLVDRYKWQPIVSCTTRPKRDYEEDGKDYHFMSKKVFAQKVIDGVMLEATNFNGWFYGTSKDSLQEGINVGVFNLEGYECLKQTRPNDIMVIGFRIMATAPTRLVRQLTREKNPDIEEIFRRYHTDQEDFLNVVEEHPDLYPIWNEKDTDLDYAIQDIGTQSKGLIEYLGQNTLNQQSKK